MKIWAKTEEFKEGKFLVVRRDGSVPHWPHFVLGARDPCAPHALREYAKLAKQMGFEPEYCKSILELADDFDRYRVEEGHGDPEAAPHRTDDPHVINAMRGVAEVTITVRRDAENKAKVTELTREQFIDRFVAHMLAITKGASANAKIFTDGSSIEEYAKQTAGTYWDDESQRADGPEDCAESDISYWEPG